MSTLFNISHLSKHYPVYKGLLRKKAGETKAVDNISFDVSQGETLGIVGESGSGKTTLAKLILRLIPPTSGSINFDGRDMLKFNKTEMLDFRKKTQIVFQDPHGSLNPRMRIKDAVGEGLIIHKITKSKKEYTDKSAELLSLVGLNPNHMSRYPHEFSGGQRQRIGIARALAVNPKVLILDEPVSSLDVSVQAQILNLLSDLKDKLNLTYIFIAHDLKVVEHISTRIIVMYMGKIVEIAEKEELYKNPLHPYTRLLLDSIPELDPEKRGFPKIPKDVQAFSSLTLPSCRFQPRCPKTIPNCEKEEPALIEKTKKHFVACGC